MKDRQAMGDRGNMKSMTSNNHLSENEKVKECQTQPIYLTVGEREKAINLPKKSRNTSTSNGKHSPGTWKPSQVEAQNMDTDIISSTPNGNLYPGNRKTSQVEPTKMKIDESFQYNLKNT